MVIKEKSQVTHGSIKEILSIIELLRSELSIIEGQLDLLESHCKLLNSCHCKEEEDGNG